MPSLLFLSGPSMGLRFDVLTEATVGRSPSCEITLDDQKVSRRHARIFMRDGQVQIADLGSRNGTLLNGERVEGEATLVPGDRVQLGESTLLYAPATHAAVTDRELEAGSHRPAHELLPSAGPQKILLEAAVGLLRAGTEWAVLDRAATEAARALNAHRAAALVGPVDGLITAAVVGGEGVTVPRNLARQALEGTTSVRAEGCACVPLWVKEQAPFGVLYLERSEPLSEEEEQVLTTLARLSGEAFARVRSQAEAEAEPTFVGTSRLFRKTMEQARQLAPENKALFIWGPRGSGKALTARFVHLRSSRSAGPLVRVDCAQPLGSLEEQLFGKPGGPGAPPLPSAAERAEGGTLLLLHLDALTGPLAERLARQFSGTGATEAGWERPSCRLIATSYVPLERLASRPDLPTELPRLFGNAEVECAALTDRRADISALFAYFTQRFARVEKKQAPTLSPTAERMVEEYGWPGNILELERVSERLAWLHPGAEISALWLPPEIQEGGAAPQRTLQEMTARLERDAIAEALREARGKKIRAAAILGISRPTLDKKIEDYGLMVEKERRAAS